MLPMFFISIPCLSIQSSLQKKKKKQLGANFGSKELNYAKKKKVSKIKLKIKKKLLLQSTVIYE
jgi:hypothetical protein